MPNSLKNKVALITGASSGIGKATAIHFASFGSRLVICGRNADALQETADACKGAGDVLQVMADLTIEADVERMIEKAIEHYKQLDVLVNNAGMYARGTIETTSLEQYDTVMNLNMRSIYQLTMLAVPHLVATKGAIVNVSSSIGLKAYPNCLSAAISKAALDQFTKCVALDLAPKQVRVNSINPGAINTNIFKRSGLTDEQINAFVERCKTTHALGRVGQPEEMAKAIAFLASDDSSFSTGVLMPVDGGRNLVCAK